jgi:hypothetical protein
MKRTHHGTSASPPARPSQPAPLCQRHRETALPGLTGRKPRASDATPTKTARSARHHTNPALHFGPSQKESRGEEQAPPWRRRGRRAATRTCRRRRRRGWRPRCGATSRASRRGARSSRRAATRRRPPPPRSLAPGTATCRSSASSRISRPSPKSALFPTEFSVLDGSNRSRPMSTCHLALCRCWCLTEQGMWTAERSMSRRATTMGSTVSTSSITR